MIEVGQLARQLSRVVICADRLEIEYAIWEQMLVDALNTWPRPRTLSELASVLERDASTHGLAFELIAGIRRRAIDTPDLLLHQVAHDS